MKYLLPLSILVCAGLAYAQPIPGAQAGEPVNMFLEQLPFSESVTFWIAFAIAALRGLAATVAEWVPNSNLGPFVSIIDFLGGNQRNASGSQ